MISTFEKNELYLLLKDFYSLVGIRISIFDDTFNMVTEYPEQSPKLCTLIRSMKIGAHACRACDIAACERAKKIQKPHLYQCHAGISEEITPIHFCNSIVGYAIFAHIIPEENYEQEANMICQKCMEYGLEEQKIRDALKSLKTYSKEQIRASARLLEAIASYMQFKKLAYLRNEDMAEQLQAFLEKNLEKDLSSEYICQHFYIARSTLYNWSQKFFGISISKYILKRRIEKAMLLIQTSDALISEIAEKVGFNDYNYFCKKFKRETGKTPTKYKKSLE